MADSLFSRLKEAWNVFREGGEQRYYSNTMASVPSELNFGRGYRRTQYASDGSVITSLYTRIAVDVASVDIRHAQLGTNKQFLSEIKSNLNRCLTLDSNLDQTARAFKQDLVFNMLENGHVCVVPVDTTVDQKTGAVDILSMRVGNVITWDASDVEVRLYNQKTGKYEDLYLPKSQVAIIENPFYSVMNMPNSTVQRLIRKIHLLDAIDEQIGSSKLDIIIQLPYVIKTEARRVEAEKRRKDIEMQLKGAQYGIAYTDGTERITQLNRPAENNMLKHVEWLTKKLYEEQGVTPAVLDGTADEQVTLNYFTRTIEPILVAITEEFTRKFLVEKQVESGEYVKALRNPFNLVPIANIAEMADKFTRNEILTSNEVRGIIGYYPSDDPKADKLRNANISAPKEDGSTESESKPKEIEQPKPKTTDHRQKLLRMMLYRDRKASTGKALKEKE